MGCLGPIAYSDIASFIIQFLLINCFLKTKTIKKNTNSTQNKYKTHRAKQYEVTSFLSTDCELSTETCSKNIFIVLAPYVLFVRVCLN